MWNIVARTVAIQGQKRIPVSIEISADHDKIDPIIESRKPERLHPTTGKSKTANVIRIPVSARAQIIDRPHQIPGQHSGNRNSERFSHMREPVTISAQGKLRISRICQLLSSLTKSPAVRTDCDKSEFCQLHPVIIVILFNLLVHQIVL